MLSQFFLVALNTAANMVKREQESMTARHTFKETDSLTVFQNNLDNDGKLKRRETIKYPSSFYRLPRYVLRDKFNRLI